MGGDLYVRYMFKKVVLTQVTTTIITQKRNPSKTAMLGGELVVNTLDDPSIKVTIHLVHRVVQNCATKAGYQKKYVQWRFIN